MVTASSLGEKSATYELIEAAIAKETLHLSEFAAPLKRLGLLAKQDQDPQAMALLGRVMLGLAKDEEALKWFRKATQSGHDFDGAAQALVQEGRILLAQRDKDGAEKAFREAALKLDDPSGYFYLSQLQEKGSLQEEVYLMKAASSGIVEACHNVGSLELQKAKRKGPMPDYRMAIEWFKVAAAGGFGPSILNLALICKIIGREEEGLKWLERAESMSGIREEAQRVRDQWKSSKIEPFEV
jgi:TPR repeat protein